MFMSIKENIFRLIEGQVVAAIATVHEGKPAVRYLAV
jgi:hypothetical protein